MSSNNFKHNVSRGSDLCTVNLQHDVRAGFSLHEALTNRKTYRSTATANRWKQDSNFTWEMKGDGNPIVADSIRHVFISLRRGTAWIHVFLPTAAIFCIIFLKGLSLHLAALSSLHADKNDLRHLKVSLESDFHPGIGYQNFWYLWCRSICSKITRPKRQLLEASKTTLQR